MNRFTTNIFYLFFAIFIAAIVLSTIKQRSQDTKLEDRHAIHGVFDLRDHHVLENEIIKLDGEWEFYWKQLLTPNDFKSQKNHSEHLNYFNVPQAWNNFQLNGERVGGAGYATYHLLIQTHPLQKNLHIKLYDIHEAYKLWVNGELVIQNGVVGTSIDTETPLRSLKLVKLVPQQEQIELILQVSNHYFRQGGIVESISIGRPVTFEKKHTIKFGLSLFYAGCIVIMGIYHIALYAFRGKEKAPLYFGIYCLLVVGYSITSNSSSWAIYAFFPDWNYNLMNYFPLACYICWASFFYRFLHSIYPLEINKNLVYFLDARIPIFITLLLFAPGIPLSWFVALCLFQGMIYATYYIFRTSLCVKRRRSGARFILLGLIGQFLVGWNDTLTHMHLIDSIYVADIGICFFVLTQSLALAQRFSRSFEHTEQLTEILESKNVSLENEIRVRNKLEQQIVNISEEERRKISHELHDGLCQQLTGARLKAYALSQKNKNSTEKDALTDLASLLKNATDSAYKTSRGLWPVEHVQGERGPSLESLVDDITKSTGAKVCFDLQEKCQMCTDENMTTLYRIAQEALTNAAKHAQANNIKLSMHYIKDNIVLRVEDDGIGRKAAGKPHGGLGMSIMAHRAKLINADIEIIDAPQGGTQVICTAPCQKIKTGEQNHE